MSGPKGPWASPDAKRSLDPFNGNNDALLLMTDTTSDLIQPEPEYPSDKELLELMPETMQDEFSYAAKVCSDATGGQVKPRIFRVALNTAALEYAQAILAHYTS